MLRPIFKQSLIIVCVKDSVGKNTATQKNVNEGRSDLKIFDKCIKNPSSCIINILSSFNNDCGTDIG